MSYTILIALILFVIYNIFVILKYDIPTSLSETAYMLGKYYWVFTGLCISTVALVMPCWFDIGSHDWDFLKFLSMIGLLFTGASPMFKKQLDKPIHFTSAIITCVCLLTWLGLNNHWWILGIGVGIFIILTTIDYKKVVYYGELCCWLGLLACIFIHK